KVAVIMPVRQGFAPETRVPEVEKQAIPQVEEEVAILTPSQPAPLMEKEAENEPIARPVIPQEHQIYAQPQPAAAPSGYFSSANLFEEAPTLVQHQVGREVHEAIGSPKESLNDRLKQEKTELAHVLKDSPIKDLRKGIGINDRFTFVSELFRGDEAMYERSIKTINGFNILSEAEYWMNRELKFKLGWNDSKEIVQHFYHLVRRRFS
ncbi:MAG TPA: hypothetical protein VHK91_15645, partial [Flavisolibacter sp.]|nr:hypothetical protein [Flavisolibacter sp.]